MPTDVASTCTTPPTPTLLLRHYQAAIWHNTSLGDHIRRLLPHWHLVPDSTPLSVTEADVTPPAPHAHLYEAIFRLSREYYDPEFWWHLKDPPALIVLLPPDTVTALATAVQARSFDSAAIHQIQSLIAAQLHLHFPPPAAGWFCKVNTMSTKRDAPVTAHATGPGISPHDVARDMVLALLASPAIVRDLHRVTKILICPWDARIAEHNEFRVFTRRSRVVGVSQQSLYHVNFMMGQWARCAADVVAAFEKLWQRCVAALAEKHMRYDECTFDGYITTDGQEGEEEEEGELTAHLIEINSGAFGWGPAGASLFEWRHDPPPQLGEEPEFRYTVP